jgi:hypothetical protein
MQRAEIDREQQQFKEQIKELKGDIVGLTTRREALEQENHRASLLMQKLGKYVGIGAGGKLEWVSFKLKYKQEQLAELVMHPEDRMNGVATLLSMVPPVHETTQQKMERMVTENPRELEPHIRRVYKKLIEAEQ